MTTSNTSGKVAWVLVAVLGVVHYDFWWWEDRTLVFGFMPIGLFFHALISIAAGLTWALVVKHAWPDWVEDWASAEPGEGTDS